MKNIVVLIFALIVSIGCKEKKQTTRIVDSQGKLKYIYEDIGDIKMIYDYNKNGALMMKLKFKQDQFIDTIYYYDFKDDKDVKSHIVKIDSSQRWYFYGTEYILLNNGKYGFKGALRFKKNADPMNAAKSQIGFGKHTYYNLDGTINEQREYVIHNDSSYVIKNVTH